METRSPLTRKLVNVARLAYQRAPRVLQSLLPSVGIITTRVHALLFQGCLGFEFRYSCFSGKCSYPLRHFSSPFFLLKTRSQYVASNSQLQAYTTMPVFIEVPLAGPGETAQGQVRTQAMGTEENISGTRVLDFHCGEQHEVLQGQQGS